MAVVQSDPKIELEAAWTAIEWKNLFAEQLDLAARQAAVDSEFVTSEHYRQALPIATVRMLEAIKTQNAESANGQRRAA